MKRDMTPLPAIVIAALAQASAAQISMAPFAPASSDLHGAFAAEFGAPSTDVPEPMIGVGCDGSGTTVGAVPVSGDADEWAAPALYYASVPSSGTGVSSALQSAMAAGHIQRTYGDFRYSAAFHDADPNNPGRILLAYNMASVNAGWDSGSTWNREHVWPQSRQPGSASNSTRGNLGDPHALRPCNPSINSSRGNKPYAFGSTSGSYSHQGSFYFPGDVDKALIARSLFYSSVRYGLQLVDGLPSGNQMGDLASLVEWHYQVPPSEFERRRNHVIYSSAHNPSYYTNNRNAFVDMPGAVWSVFKDNLNDSQLWVGDSALSDGSSMLELCQRVIVGTFPEGVEVTLNRAGLDGTYYAVTPVGDAITDQPLTNGFTGAFAINDTTPRSIIVGVDPVAVSGPGLYSGDVWIDNLDMTDGLGSGFGANDGDDLVVVTAEVLDPALASFSDVVFTETVNIDFGSMPSGTSDTIQIPIYALEGVAGFTAGATVTLASATGDTMQFDLSLPAGVIDAGSSADAVIEAFSTTTGAFAATYELQIADDPTIGGAGDRHLLTINVVASVGECPADLTTTGSSNGDPSFGVPDGVTDLADLLFYVNVWNADLGNPTPNPGSIADVTTTGGANPGVPDGDVDLADLLYFVSQWDAGIVECP